MRLLFFCLLAAFARIQCEKYDQVLDRDVLGPNSPWISNRVKHVAGEINHARFNGASFTASRDVISGHTEYRAFHNHVVGMETVISRVGETALFFREVTDGKRLIKLLYAGRLGLVECDVERNMAEVDGFLSRFSGSETRRIGELRRQGNHIDMLMTLRMSNVVDGNSLHVADDGVIGEPYATMVDIDNLHTECGNLHHQLQHKMAEHGIDVESYRRVMTSEDDAPREFIPRRVKRTRRGAKSRSKRGLIVPDTKWCGAGSSHENFEDVGVSRAADRCCREHDHCPYYIEAMSTNYNLFNARLYTISHCYCDEVFRTCLKTASTDQSAMIGNVYFNLLGMKCFEFEIDQVCKKRSWWGYCQKYEDEVVAKIRGSLSWE